MKKIKTWLKSLLGVLTKQQSEPSLTPTEHEESTESGDRKTETTTSTESEAAREMVNRIIAGDQKAEEEMIQKYHKGLLSILFNRCGDKALAEEVAQDTWLIVIQTVRKNELRRKDRLGGYIVQVAKNQLIFTYRRKSQKYQTQLSDEILDTQPSAEERVHSKQLYSTILAILGSMTVPRDREILTRYYLKDESKTEIAESLNVSEAHFDRVLFRARERFKTLFPKDPTDDEPNHDPDEDTDDDSGDDSEN